MRARPTVLCGLLVAAVVGCAATPPAGPVRTTSGDTPEQVRAGAVRAAREAARELAGLRFTVDGAGRYAQCTDDGELILFDVVIRLRRTPATVPPPRTPAIVAALARRGWALDRTRGSSAGTDTSTVLTKERSGLRITEYAADPGLLLLELTSDCVDAGDRTGAYVDRGGEILRLT